MYMYVHIYICIFTFIFIYTSRVSPRVQSYIISLYDYVIKTVSLSIYVIHVQRVAWAR